MLLQTLFGGIQVPSLLNQTFGKTCFTHARCKTILRHLFTVGCSRTSKAHFSKRIMMLLMVARTRQTRHAYEQLQVCDDARNAGSSLVPREQARLRGPADQRGGPRVVQEPP